MYFNYSTTSQMTINLSYNSIVISTINNQFAIHNKEFTFKQKQSSYTYYSLFHIIHFHNINLIPIIVVKEAQVVEFQVLRTKNTSLSILVVSYITIDKN